MPSLDIILPFLNPARAGENEHGQASSDTPAEPFTILISRALAPNTRLSATVVSRPGIVLNSNTIPGQRAPAPDGATEKTVAAGSSGKCKTTGKPKSDDTHSSPDSSPQPPANMAAIMVSEEIQVVLNQAITSNAPFIAGSPMPAGVNHNPNSVPKSELDVSQFKNGPAQSISSTELAMSSALSNGSLSPANIPASTASLSKKDEPLVAKIQSDEKQKITDAVAGLQAEPPDSGDVKVNTSDKITNPAPLIPEMSETETSAVTAAITPQVLKSVNAEKTTLCVAGTSVAKLEVTMKKAEKTTKIAGSAEKILPGNSSSLALKNNLPVGLAGSSAEDARNRVLKGSAAIRTSAQHPSSEFNLSTGTATGNVKSVVTARLFDTASTSSASELHSRTVECTHDMIVVQASRLQDSDLDSLRVVIKPGAGMQLTLELRQHGDSVKAEAVLQQGDFNHLNQHWPELQQRLEQRGVRLAPLSGQENAAAFAGHDGSQKQPRQQAAESEPLYAGALAEFAISNPASSSPFHPHTTPIPLNRNWESWA